MLPFPSDVSDRSACVHAHICPSLLFLCDWALQEGSSALWESVFRQGEREGGVGWAMLGVEC